MKNQSIVKEHGLIVDAREANGLHNKSITVIMRVMEKQPCKDICGFDRGSSMLIEPYCIPDGEYAGEWAYHAECDEEGLGVTRRCPLGVPGDRLWVEEDWFAFTGHGRIQLGHPATRGHCKIGYRAAMKDSFGAAYRRAQTMSRWASRTLLDVTDVRVMRAQEVTEEDARATGLLPLYCPVVDDGTGNHLGDQPSFALALRKLYDGGKWLWLATVRKVEDE